MQKNKLTKTNCSACPLFKQKLIVNHGDIDKADLICVGIISNQQNIQNGNYAFAGIEQTIVESALKSLGLEYKSIYYTNKVRCREPFNSNQYMLDRAISCCEHQTIYDLKNVDSSVPVLHFGTESLNSPTDVYNGYISYERFIQQIAVALNHDFGYVVCHDPDITYFIEDELTTDYIERCVNLLDAMLGCVVFDIETSGLQYYATANKPADVLLMIALSPAPDKAIIINDVLLYESSEVKQALQRLFYRCYMIAHNGKFDIIFLKSALNLDIKLNFDTMLAHYLLDENSRHGLKELSSQYLNAKNYESEIKKYIINNDYSTIPTEVLAKYAALDVCYTYSLYLIFEKDLKDEDMYNMPFQEILINASNMLVDVELTGFAVDLEQLNLLNKAINDKLEPIIKRMKKIAGYDINLNSSSELSDFIYNNLKIPYLTRNQLIRIRVAKETSTSSKVLDLLQHHEFIELLKEYRRVFKIKTSYVDNLYPKLDFNNRVHADFLIHGTETGRISVKNPALQTIPKAKDIWGTFIKSCYVSSENSMLVIADYSQCELRVLANTTLEPFLLDVYDNNRDLHDEGTNAMFGTKDVLGELEYSNKRRDIKNFNFAWVYGGTVNSFAASSGMNIQEAIKFVSMYEKNMPVAVQWKKDQYIKMKKYGYVQSTFKRKRRFTLITPNNKEEARKSSGNSPIQSDASDLTMLAAIELHKMGYKIVLIVHDSIIMDIEHNLIDQASKDVIRIMVETGNKYMSNVKWKADLDEPKKRWAKSPV